MERETYGEKILSRVLGIVAGGLLVFIIFLYARDTRPVEVTVGTLADRRSDFVGRRVVIHNAGLGKRVGQFVFFDTIDGTRHCVVLALSGEVEPGCTTFRGYVLGVTDEKIMGCPHDPPFLYVMDVKPVKD